MIAWAIDTAIGVTLIMALVLALRGPVAHLFGAGWAYALWLLPLLRIALPPFDLFGAPMAATGPLVVVPAQAALAAASTSGSASSGDLAAMLVALWAGGLAAFVMWQQSAYGAFLLSLGRNCRPGDPPEHGGVKVVESSTVDGPVAVGILRRRIVVPFEFSARYCEAERRLALDHELIHHRRGDILWNWLALTLLAIMWFNPVAWFAFRAFRIDQELACDAAVAARADAAARLDYAQALVKAASRPGEIAGLQLGRANQLKRRLKMLPRHRVSRARTLGGAAAFVALGALGLVVASPGIASEDAPALAPILAAQSTALPSDEIITKAEIATLEAKCGSDGPQGSGNYGFGMDGRSGVRCPDGRVIDDPEARAIIDRTGERARAHVAAVTADLPTPEHMAEVERAVEQAQTSVEQIMDEQEARAEAVAETRAHAASMAADASAAAAEASARAALLSIDPDAIAASAKAGALAAVHNIHLDHPGMSAEDRAELRRDMEELKRDLAGIDVEVRRELRQMQEELRRELRDIHRDTSS